MKQRAQESPKSPAQKSSDGDIAIIGVACRFPDAPDYEQFFENLRYGVRSIREIPHERWDVDEFYSPDLRAPNRSVSKWCGLLDDIDRFDASFFRISPREAAIMDPQQRLLLEEAWRCLEDSGLPLHELRERTTSVHVGAMGLDHYQRAGMPGVPIEAHSMGGVMSCALSNRISYALGLGGPSLSLDAGCAASLVAVEQAMRTLQRSASDFAIAAGVTVFVHPFTYITMSKSRIISAEGLCRTFDKDAAGMVQGEGVGVLLLQRLEDAIAEGNHVHGVIKGAAVNHGGAARTFTAPRVEAQRDMLLTAFRDADISPDSITYVEAHGTGTPLGDPIEVEALTRAFREYTDDRQFCAIGSAKTNIGHLQAAAGVAGLIKVLMMMRHGELVPTINLSQPNPMIDFTDSPFAPALTDRAWRPRRSDEPLRAGISSFGFSGSNAHVLVESYEDRRPPPEDAPDGCPFVLSARTKRSLQKMLARWQTLADSERWDTLRLRDVAGTLATGRESFAHRFGLWVTSTADLRAKLAEAPSIVSPSTTGSWWLHVGDLELSGYGPVGELAERDQVFAACLERAEAALADVVGEPSRVEALRAQQWPENDAALLSLVVTHARVASLRELGFEPAHISGHGSGFWAALVASGMVAFDEALGVLAGHTAQEELALSRPEVAFFDPVAGQSLMPHRFDAEYLRALLATPTLPEAVLTEQVERARLVGEAQYTFRRYLEEWERVLDSRGYSLEQLLVDPATLPLRQQLLVLVVLVSSMRRLDRKWNLTHRPLDLPPPFFELLGLVMDQVLPAEVLVDLFVTSKPDLDAVAAEMQSNQHRLRHRSEYPLLAARSSALSEIEDIAGWLAEAPHESAPPVQDGWQRLGLGRMPAASANVRAPGLEASTPRIALDLWLQGASIDWTQSFPQGSFRRQPLPTYEFDGKPYRWQGDTRSREESARVYYCSHWAATPLRTAHEPRGPVLIFGRDERQCAEAAQHLDRHVVIQVQPGPGFRDLGGLRYQVRPGHREDYRKLLDALQTRGSVPRSVVHMWSGTEDDRSLDASVYSMLALIQVLVGQHPGRKLAVLYVYRSREGDVRPEHEAMAGLLRTIRQEHPAIAMRAVALRDTESWPALAAELGAPRGPVEVCYRGGERLVKKLQSVKLQASQDAPGIRPGGVYLITGGLGALGLILAEHLTRCARAINLVLVGRSPITPERAMRIRRLEALGAKTLYRPQDISRREGVNKLIEKVHARFGQVNGVIHAAGVMRPGYVEDKAWSDVETTLAPKITGVQLLDEALAEEPLDFFAVFSSITAVRGFEGLADYAYANSYLNAFAEWREIQRAAGRRSGRTSAIAWPLWKGGGMRFSAQDTHRYAERTGLALLPAAEGMAMWDAILASSLGPDWVVGYGDPERMAAFFAEPLASEPWPDDEDEAATVPIQAHIGEEPGVDPEVLRPQVEAFLRDILAEELELPASEIDATEELGSYGIDSVLVHHFNARVEDLLGPVSRTVLYEVASLHELTEYFLRHHVAELVAALAPSAPAEEAAEAAAEQSEPPAPARAPVVVRDRRREPAEEHGGDIAIIGLAGRYPGARDLDELWDNLRTGRDCVTEIPAERWDHRRYYDPDPSRVADGKMYAYWGAFLDDVDRFDSLFFRISHREAERLDPQERLFLQTAWAAFEDAGYTRTRLDDEVSGEVGVFAGIITGYTYSLFGPGEWSRGRWALPESLPWSVANRVSYALGLNGPSMPVDTACSSSLTAVHLACESLRRGECRMALAGGVSLLLHPARYLYMCQYRMLSPAGRCHTFSDRADGFVPGEGVGAVLLKPLAEAIRDRDAIYAVIRGSAINHGGRTHGYTVPSPKAQGRLIRTALERARVNPRTVSYVEAHGTGTALGDPIEVAGLTQAFREHTSDRHFCSIASLKSNIGHLESAAGIAGLTKVILQMKHATLVPSLHVERLNPDIDFASSPFVVQRERTPWQRPVVPGVDEPVPLRAGVSSFGAGGANAHVVLEAYEAPRAHAGRRRAGPEIAVLSARSKERLRAYAGELASHIERHRELELADIAHTLQVGREAMEERLAIVTDDKRDLCARLARFAAGDDAAVMCGQAGRAEPHDSDARAARDPAERARAWVRGARVEWNAAGERRRVPLPTYPFRGERLWIGARGEFGEDPLIAQQVLHPLIDSNESTLAEHRYRKRFTAAEPWVRDHAVDARLIVPGTVLVEMARAAGHLAAEQPVWKVRNVAFGAPIAVDDEPRDVWLRLREERDALGFSVYSQGGAGGEVVHAQGSLITGEAPASSETLDVEAIRRRCRRVVDERDAYELLAAHGLRMGPSFQTNTTTYVGDGEALAMLRLAAHLEDGRERLEMHPALLDGAQQTAMVAMLHLESAHTVHVPFSVAGYERRGPLPAVGWAYARFRGERKGSTSVVTFDCWITDEHGRVVARVESYVGRPMRGPVAAADTLYFREHREVRAVAGRRSAGGPVLLLADGEPLREQVRTRLGDTVLVRPGRRFERVDAHTFAIAADVPEDHERLWATLVAEGRRPSTVIHGWSTVDQRGGTDDLSDALALGPRALLCLARAMHAHAGTEPLRLIYGFCSRSGWSEPVHAAARGLLRTFEKEVSRLSCRVVELCASELSAISVAQLADALVAESLADDGAWADVRYEHGQRWWAELVEVDLEQEARAGRGARVVEGGVYVITGGAGGLGLLVAEHLATRYRARLALCGRSLLTPGVERRLDDMRRTGAEIMYVQADVTRRADVRELVAGVQARFGRIHGVIHAAGLLRDGYLHQKRMDDMDAVLAPKVLGAVYLDEALASHDLELFVLFSSASARVGNPGQSDYAYANRFLDAFARLREARRAAGERRGRTISVDWPLWKEGGMRVDRATEEYLFRSLGMQPLTTEAGLRAFELALAAGDSGVLVMQGDPERIRRALRPPAPPLGTAAPEAARAAAQPSDVAPAGAAALMAAPAAAQPSEEVIHGVQKELARLASARLGMTARDVDVRRDLSAYGMDSVGFVELANQVNERFGVDITPAIFFEYPSIADLARHLVEEYPDAFAAPASAPARGADMSAAGHTAPVAASAVVSPAAPQPIPASIAPASIAPASFGGKVPIAIIGMGARFPRSQDLEDFWEHLAQDRFLGSEIPKERWDWEEIYGDPATEENRTNIKWGVFLDDVDCFDARFFGISKREAEYMDPQQRIFLEVVWQTIEDAGYRVSELSQWKVGLFTGASGLDYKELLDLHGVPVEAHSTPGAMHSIVANRVSYLLDLRGPSLPLDTACSSALMAIRLAIESIWTGSCELAVAGGVNLLLSPTVYVSCNKAGMLSPDGRCMTFDKRANGYLRSEGAGAVLLKPLDRAIADGDNIHAVIRGSAINHGGRVNTMTAPNPNAQAELIKNSVREAGVHPATVTYIEAHGSGTSLGDPIEINGIKKAYGELLRDAGPADVEGRCGIGAVKTNIGHMEAAAALPGLFKVVLGMKHGTIPANVNFEELNPYIDLDGTRFYIAHEQRPWPRLVDPRGVEVPRRAGLSAFGFGGASGHMVIEEYIRDRAPAQDAGDAAPQVVVLSARTEERLRVYAARMATFFERERAAPRARQAEPAVATAETAAEIRQWLVMAVAELAGVSVADIDPDEPVTEWGLDASRVRALLARIYERQGISLPVSAMVEHPSMSMLAEVLARYSAQNPQAKQPEADTDEPPEALSLADVAYTLQVGREPMAARLAMIVRSMDEVVSKLAAFAAGEDDLDDVYTGTAGSGDRDLEALLGGQEGDVFVRNLVANQRLDKLCRLWATGVSVDWKALHAEPRPRRVSLPTYPFARDRFWLPKVGRWHLDNRALHPLLDELDKRASLGSGVVFTKTLRPGDRVVSHHRVAGRPVLPGVGHLAMVLAAVAQLELAGRVELADVVWLRPVVVEGEMEVRVHLWAIGEGLRFEVHSGSSDDAVVHATGEVRVHAGDAGPQYLALDALRARLQQPFDPATLYREAARTGVDFGAYFQVLKELWVGADEVLAEVAMAAEFAHEADDHGPVIPPLMDAALQASVALAKARDGGARLPFAVERVEVLQPVGARGRVYVKKLDDGTLNAAILDEEGRVCVTLHRVTLREAAAPAQSAQPARPVETRDRGFFYRPVWRSLPWGNGAASQELQRHGTGAAVVIVRPPEDAGLGAALAARHRGEAVHEIVLGEHDRQLGAQRWEVRASDPDALAACLERAPVADRMYFLGVASAGGPGDMQRVEADMERGVMSLFRLVKGLLAQGRDAGTLALTVVTADAQEVFPGEPTQPSAAGLVGLVRSLAKEVPAWKVACIDVRTEEAAASPAELAEIIAAERGDEDGDLVAVRGGQRYGALLEPVRMPVPADLPLRAQGVYLILGGAGGIGLALARHLAERVQARVVLLGRSAPDERHRAAIADIEARGGEALYLAADATDPASVRAAVARAQERFGGIHGAVHSALVLRDRSLRNMDEATMRAVLGPKVQGSVAFAQALADQPLDFLLFFSSTQSFSGLPGQANYAAASTFEDAYARYLDRVCGYPVKVINWGFWGSVGVVASEEYIRRLAALGVGSIEVEEGMDAIERVLGSRLSQVIAIKAEERFLRTIRVDLSREVDVLPEDAPPVMAAILGADATRSEA